MQVTMIRHIQPVVATGTCYGQLDVPIPEDCQRTHQAIVAQLPPFDSIVYSSPLSRCASLAKEISQNYLPDARLMELNFGQWEGKAWDAIDREALDVWGENYIHSGPPEGESLQALCNRFADFIHTLKGDKIILVTHAGIIRCAHHIFHKTPLSEVMAIPIAYGGIYTFNTI